MVLWGAPHQQGLVRSLPGSNMFLLMTSACPKIFFSGWGKLQKFDSLPDVPQALKSSKTKLRTSSQYLIQWSQSMKNDLYQQNFKFFSFSSGFEFQTGLRLQKHLYAVSNLISYAWITQNESSTDEENQKVFLQKNHFFELKFQDRCVCL